MWHDVRQAYDVNQWEYFTTDQCMRQFSQLESLDLDSRAAITCTPHHVGMRCREAFDHAQGVWPVILKSLQMVY